MIKSLTLVCATGAAVFAIALAAPPVLNATPSIPDAPLLQPTSLQAAAPVPATAELYFAEKMRAVQQELPAQF
jgi:hypothetical protein